MQTIDELRAEVEALEAVHRRIRAIERTRPLSAEELDALREIVREAAAADAAADAARRRKEPAR
ncbi:MAG: hypothetical protein ACYC61_17820 [Isosphaeraceae bacterium]